MAGDCRAFDRITIDIMIGDACELLATLEAVGLASAAAFVALAVDQLQNEKMAIPLRGEADGEC